MNHQKETKLPKAYGTLTHIFFYTAQEFRQDKQGSIEFYLPGEFPVARGKVSIRQTISSSCADELRRIAVVNMIAQNLSSLN